ncbi:HDOD domain-containing protein [Aliikangiella marina]|uniref:HDOD domain-containing protein n=1 Tax=Aliikangiella marina TaxID=1712262 RepID=A0A545T9Q6_9GAMM|nr:HDOD domain-containing protein [Aliikangiella marina]TQV73942.1 HDOD domain-containing protein [Aliikangiella marina]
MSRRNILLQIHKDLAAGDIRLPILPEVSLKIKREAADPDTDINKLSKVAESDAAFCGYLIQISNSPVYRGAAEIQKVPLAIGRLGLLNTRNIAMTYAIRALFAYNNKKMATWLKKIWQNSTYTAAVASVIAEHIQDIRFDPDEAILGGLVQDIGCLPLIDKAAQYPELIEDDSAMYFLFERYASSIGSAIIRKWGLNEKFIQVAQYRDQWKYNEEMTVNLADLILVSKLHTYIAFPQNKKLPRINQIPAFVKLHLEAELSPEKSLSFVADAKQRINDTRRALGG